MADLITEAQQRHKDALDESSDQRKQIEEDLEFSDPSNPQQWDKTEKLQREQDPGGARPCLVLDQLGQYVANVAGQVEQRPPAIHAIPVGDGSDRRVAEQLDGFYRHIEHSSRAQQHYARVLTSAARCGVGYLIVRPEYTDRPLGYQEPRISSEGDPLRVVLDPWSVELDGSDANWGQLLIPFSYPEFERQFGAKAEKVSFGDSEQHSEDKRTSIIVAEEWRIVDETEKVVVYQDSRGSEFSMGADDFQEAKSKGDQTGDPLTYIREYTDKTRCVKWVRMSGAEILTEETDYPADSIGIVPVYGYVGWSGGRMKYCGIPRRAREAQRAYNYHVSEIRAYMSQAPKAPYLAPVRAIRGLESLWDRASVESRAYLPFHDVDESGQEIAPPQRVQIATNLQNHTQGAEQALRDIQGAIGMYQANLGAPSNETSGVAIENRKSQGEASTSHFPSHLAASLGQVGKLCMQMIPRLIDKPRQMRILGIDMTPSKVQIDPQQSKALVEDEQNGLTINPNVGEYDVRVVVGASFSTQRQQAQEAYTEMMRANPAMMPAIAPLWAQTLDVPHADKLAQVLTAVAPDAVKAILQPDQQETTATLKTKIDQLNQALQEAIQHAKDAQQDADEANSKLNTKVLEHETKSDEIAVEAFDALTRRMQVVGAAMTPEQVAEIAQQTIAQAMAQPNPAEDPSEQGPQEAQEQQQEGGTTTQMLSEILNNQERMTHAITQLFQMVTGQQAPPMDQPEAQPTAPQVAPHESAPSVAPMEQ